MDQTAQLATFPPAGFIFIHDTQGKSRNRLMREEGMNTNPQIYYNNKHASTPQASKRKKKASQMKTICTLEYTEVENTHKIK